MSPPKHSNKIIIRSDKIKQTKTVSAFRFKDILTIYTPLLTIFSLTIHNLYFYETVHISETKLFKLFFHYSKKNLMNLLFIKKGLIWVFPLIIISRLVSNERSNGVFTRLFKVFCVWYVTVVSVLPFTKVPSITDVLFYYSGGVCQYDAFDNEMTLKQKIKVRTLGHCRSLKGKWVNGHDLSGHLFFLSLMCWVVGMEVFVLNGKSYNKTLKYGRLLKNLTSGLAAALLIMYGYNIIITILNEFHQYSEIITGFLWGYLSGYWIYNEYL